jgi:hypothetical protein
MELHADGGPVDGDVPDAVRQCVEYLRDRARSETPHDLQSLRDRLPDLYAAHDIHIAAGVVRDEIEARLLAGQTFEDITAYMSVPVDVIARYAHLFFDVVDYLHCSDWLLWSAVRRSPSRPSRADEGDIWRYMSLAGGRFVLDVIVADYLGRSQPILPNRDLLAKQLRWLARDHFDYTDYGSRVDPMLLDEGTILFADTLHKQCVIGGNRILASQVNFLRYISRLPANKHLIRAARGSKRSSRRSAPKSKPFHSKETHSWTNLAPMD